MAEHLIFHDCPAGTKEAVHDYWGRKARRIARLLHHFPEDQRHLRLCIRRHPERYEVRAVLSLPTGSLVAEASGRDCLGAMDIMMDRLAMEIRRHKEQLRHESAYRRRRRRQAEVAAAAPMLREPSRQRDKATFMDLLRPILRSLRDHAQRELVLAQIEGLIRPGEFTLSDLLDEVMTRAWDRFDRRSAALPLDQWLVELLHEILDERLEQEGIPTASLDQPLPGKDAVYETDTGWVVENDPFWNEPQPLTLEELLPSTEVPEPWQQVAAHEQRRWILDQLRTLPRLQRRAFILSILENWSEDDIAMIQRRSPAEVREDIEAARNILRERLHKAVEMAG